jgi:hypothetical protein
MPDEEEEKEKQITGTLEEMRVKGMTDKISIEWCAEDVLQQDSELTAEQVQEVLTELKHHHDANIGVNWCVIDCVIDQIKGR